MQQIRRLTVAVAVATMSYLDIPLCLGPLLAEIDVHVTGTRARARKQYAAEPAVLLPIALPGRNNASTFAQRRHNAALYVRWPQSSGPQHQIP